MIFENFFRNSFDFDISRWTAPLAEARSGIVILLYCCLNLFLPLCFDSIAARLTAASWSAALLLMFFLYFSPGKIADLCAFKKLEQGNGGKVFAALFLAMLLVFICHYWSCEFFKYIGWSVSERQELAESLKDAGTIDMIVIGITSIILAPVGEEIVFRRMLYGLLAPRGGVRALFLSSFVFSLIHFYPAGIAGLFFLALILQLLYLNTKNIFCSIQVHMFFNALSFIAVLGSR